MSVTVLKLYFHHMTCPGLKNFLKKPNQKKDTLRRKDIHSNFVFASPIVKYRKMYIPLFSNCMVSSSKQKNGSAVCWHETNLEMRDFSEPVIEEKESWLKKYLTLTLSEQSFQMQKKNRFKVPTLEIIYVFFLPNVF